MFFYIVISSSMKKNICIACIISSLLLFWCTNKQGIDQVTTYPQIYTEQHIVQTGSLPWSKIISWAHDNISITWYTLVYEGIFHIEIPSLCTQWEYLLQDNVLLKHKTDRFLFSNNEGTSSLSIHVWAIPPEDLWWDDTIFCRREYMEKPISQSARTINKSWTNIYIDNAEFMAYPQWDTPTRNKQARVCFVDSGIVYSISFSNFSEKDFLTAITSLYLY